MKIAIIGTGISGLGAAYLLSQKNDVTVYEKNATLGGHSRTIDITVDDKKIAVDTGFIVFNHENYPHLTGLFRYMGVETVKSDMSFGVSVAGGKIEYGSHGIFSQKRNLLRPKYWGMLSDIMRFNRGAEAILEEKEDITMRECLDRLGMGDWFRRYYLQAMGAAIWSCSVDMIEAFPAQTFIRFFKNHGLLTVNGHPQWYTVKGGSRKYIEKIILPFAWKIRAGSGVRAVTRQQGSVIVVDNDGRSDSYDHAIFACHADQALEMLQNPTPDEKRLLGAFSYQKNTVIVHGDKSFMPRTRGSWASWVYLSEQALDDKPVVSLSYWMNNLQPLDTSRPVVITLNPGRRPREEKIYDEHVFEHPVFNIDAIRAQRQMDDIQGKSRLWFCGAYLGYGFHEDGLKSAVDVAQKLGTVVPWL